MRTLRLAWVAALLLMPVVGSAHPLRLSLCQIEYSSQAATLTVSLRLFLTDVNEALVFDPYSRALRFAEADESENAEPLLLAYLDEFFSMEANGEPVPVSIQSKVLGGAGEDTTLSIGFSYRLTAPLRSMTIKNGVFTDLFFDQTNIVYVHVDDDSHSMMLSKSTPSHTLEF